MIARPISPDSAAVARVRRARSQIVTAHPFFGALALSLDLQERADVPTMSTDGARLAFRPEFVAKLSEAELMGAIAHEVLHLAYLHPVRRGGRDLARWNEACDYAINLDVLAAGFKLPAGALVDSRWQGMGAESIYAAREAERSKSGGNAAGKPGGGNAAGKPGGEDAAGKPDAAGSAPPDPMTGAPDPGACGGVVDAAPDGASMAEQAGKLESMIRQAAAVACAGAGEMPAGIGRIIGDLNRPRIDWRAMLGRFIDDAATRVTDWSRPDKRHADSGFFLPARKSDSVACVAVVIDTSGSISPAVLDACTGEVQAILDSGRVERVHLVYCDRRVHGSRDLAQGDCVPREAPGGGGTAFAPAFVHIAAHAPDAAAIVYLTDLDAGPGDFGPEPAAPVLWLQYGRPRSAPFGEIVPIDPHA